MYKVIIVEDEPIIQKGIHFKVDWLSLNCTVFAIASNGQEGIQLIEKHQPDIVITDVRMPLLSGLDMLKQTKEKYNYEAIIISGYDEFEYAKRAIQLGVTDFILKPIHFEELHAALTKITEKLRHQKTKKQSSIELAPLLIESKDTYVTNMIQYIQDHYHEKISIQDMSEILQVSHMTLHTKFKKATNYTFNDYLNRYRIRKALELMNNSSILIYEIANQVGYSDYKYFSQVFKKYTGVSPSQFKQE